MKEKEKQKIIQEQADRLKLLIDDLGLTQKKIRGSDQHVTTEYRSLHCWKAQVK